MNAKHLTRKDLSALVPQYPSNFIHKKLAFTLAETLITFGIIGVVAALTLPTLIENHNRKVVEARLEKLYSTMNQAIRMAELDYGERETWFVDYNDVESQKKWIEKYLLPYLNYTKFEKILISNAWRNAIYFSDGSILIKTVSNGRDWYFSPGNIDKCIKSSSESYKNFVGKCTFAFYYNPVSTKNDNVQKLFNTYGTGWTYVSKNPDEILKYDTNFGCYNEENSWHGFCAALIQRNGWKFPKDYPYRVHY